MKNEVQFTYGYYILEQIFTVHQNSFNYKLKHESDGKYKDFGKKFHLLVIQQRKIQKVERSSMFYEGMVNMSDMEINKRKINLLNTIF
jgi:hypothetical protein